MRVSVCVSVCVCVSRLIFSTIFVRFWWKCTQMIWTKIWDDTFFIFSNFCFDDVITAILYIFRWGTLMVVILSNFLQIDNMSSSTDGVEWDCKPAFYVIIFKAKWRLEKPLKTKWSKTQNKSPILIKFDLVNTNMCMVCWSDLYFSCYRRLKSEFSAIWQSMNQCNLRLVYKKRPLK